MWGGVGIVGGNSAINNGAVREIDLSHLLSTFSVIWSWHELVGHFFVWDQTCTNP